MAKEFTYQGKKLQELQELNLSDLVKLLPSRARRSLKRPLSYEKKKLLEDIRSDKRNIKTHVRDLPILPDFVGKTICVYNGKEFVTIQIQSEMIGHMLGEFSLTRKKISHSAPGVGATRSSSNVSVK